MGFDVWYAQMRSDLNNSIPEFNSTADAFEYLYREMLKVRDASAMTEPELRKYSTTVAKEAVTNFAQGVSDESRKIREAGASAQETIPSMQMFTEQLRNMSGIELTKEAESVAKMANAIGQLGYAKVDKAATNLPKVTAALKQMMQELSTAPAVSENVIRMTEAIGQLQTRVGTMPTQTKKASTGWNTFSQIFLSGSNKMRISSFSLAAAWGKMYASFFMVFRAFNMLKKAINLSAEMTEQQHIVDVAFGEMSDRVAEFSKNSIKNLGMSQLTVAKTAGRFQAMGNALGITGDKVEKATANFSNLTGEYAKQGKSMADMSLGLTRLTADMSAFYNEDYADMAEAMQTIFTGQARPLRRFGIDISQTTLKEWAMKQGLDANIESMTQAEKAMLRYQYVMQHSQQAHGDFARTSNTWANQVRILKENFQALGIVVGQGLIQAFKPALIWINNALVAVTEFAEKVVNALGKIFGWQIDISAGSVDYGDVADGIGDIGDAADGAGKSVKDLKGQLQGFDKLNVLTTPSNGSGGGGGGGGASGGGAGGGGDVGFSVKDTVGLFESEIDSLGELGEYISQRIGDALGNIDWEKVYEKARNFGKGLAEFLNGLFGTREDGGNVFSDVGKTIAGALNTAIYAAFEFLDKFDFKTFGENFASGFNDFFDGVDWKTLGMDVHMFIQGIKEALVNFLKTLKWKDILSDIGTFAGQLTPEDIALVFAAWGSMKVGSWVISGGLQQMIVGALPKLAAKLPALLAPLGLSVFGAIVTGILAAGAGLLVNALFSKIAEAAGKTAEEIKQAGVGGFIGAIAGAILGGIVTVITGGAGVALIPAFTALGTAAGEGIVYIVQALKKRGKELLEKFSLPNLIKERLTFGDDFDWSEITTNLIEKLSELPKTIQNKIGKLLDKIDLTKVASSLGKNLGKAFGKAIRLGIRGISIAKTLIKTVKKKIVTFFTDTIPSIVQGIKNVDWWKVTKNIIEGILSFASNVGKTVKIVKDAVKSFFDSFIDGFKSVFGIHSPAKAKEIVDLGENIIKGILESVKSFLSKPGDFFSSIGTKIVDGIKGGVTKIIGKGVSWLKKLFTGSDSGDFGVTANVGTKKQGAWSKFKSLVGWVTGNDTSETTTTNTVKQQRSSGWESGLKYWITGTKSGESHTYNNVHQQKSSGWKGWTQAQWVAGNKDGTSSTTNTVKLTPSYGRYSNLAQLISGGYNYVSLKAKIEINEMTVANGVHITGYAGRLYPNLATGGMLIGNDWKPIPQYASGTLSAAQGELFVAREAGPELVGSIGGHSAVMNNDQIVSSVAYGVESGVRGAMAEQNAILRSQNTILTQILAKEYGITQSDVFNAVRSENVKYINRTGRSAFSY
jgi:hypothetical protein